MGQKKYFVPPHVKYTSYSVAVVATLTTQLKSTKKGHYNVLANLTLVEFETNKLFCATAETVLQ